MRRPVSGRDAVRSQVIDVLKAQEIKKVSTLATKASSNIFRQTLTIGLDLGDRNSWYCVLDEAGRIQLEQRVGTNARALREVFGAMPRSRIALETGTHSPWISRLLSGERRSVRTIAPQPPHDRCRSCVNKKPKTKPKTVPGREKTKAKAEFR